MIIVFSKVFEKSYLKLDKKIQNKIDNQILLFKNDLFNPLLKNHKLHGKWLGYFSINVTGDMRIIYKKEKDSFVFLEIGSHSELYR